MQTSELHFKFQLFFGIAVQWSYIDGIDSENIAIRTEWFERFLH